MTSRLRSLMLCPALAWLALSSSLTAQNRSGPVNRRSPQSQARGTPAISPDGQLVAYTIRETNWDENAYETEIWIGDAATGQSRQVTNARKSSSQPAFSPDGTWLGFISDRDGKRQIYRIALDGGEAEKLTRGDEGVNSFRVVARRQADRVHDDRSGGGQR